MKLFRIEGKASRYSSRSYQSFPLRNTPSKFVGTTSRYWSALLSTVNCGLLAGSGAGVGLGVGVLPDCAATDKLSPSGNRSKMIVHESVFIMKLRKVLRRTQPDWPALQVNNSATFAILIDLIDYA